MQAEAAVILRQAAVTTEYEPEKRDRHASSTSPCSPSLTGKLSGGWAKLPTPPPPAEWAHPARTNTCSLRPARPTRTNPGPGRRAVL